MSIVIRDKHTAQIRVSKRGTKKYFSKTVHIPDGLTKRERDRFLEDEERKFENECKGGCKNANIAFAVFLEQDYFVNNPRKDDYKSMLSRTLPQIGHIRMSEFTRFTIQNFVNRLAKDTNTKSGKPLSVKTIRNNVSFISKVFAYAISTGMNVENPCRDIAFPKSRKKESKYYTDEEMLQLMETMDKHPPETKYKLFCYIAMSTGMRKGEILGLEWKNIELDTGVIHVVQAAKYNATEGMHIGPPKTEKGVRVVRVPADVIELLKLYKAEQERYILDIGDKWIGTDFLFTQHDGSLMSIQTPYEWLREYCAKYGLTFKAIHSMRHYVASAMILSHMEDIKVSRVLGHAQVSTTKEIYAHLFDDASDEARRAMESRLFKNNKGD